MSMDVEQSIKGFVKAIGRNEMLPFLSIYQRLVSSYFIFKKLRKTYNPDFLLVTGDLTVLPKSMAERTIVYERFPTPKDLKSSRVLRDYTSNIWKRLYIQPYLFISKNIDYNNDIDFSYIKKGTIIANSNYTKNAIKKVWNIDSTVIYPPVDLERFSSCLRSKSRNNQVLVISRFSPEKQLEKAIFIAKILKNTKFIIIGNLEATLYIEKDNLE